MWHIFTHHELLHSSHSLHCCTQSSTTFQFTRGIPEGCNPSECDYFIGINPSKNKNLLDITLEGNAKGWIAVGFTKTPSMVILVTQFVHGSVLKYVTVVLD